MPGHLLRGERDQQLRDDSAGIASADVDSGGDANIDNSVQHGATSLLELTFAAGLGQIYGRQARKRVPSGPGEDPLKRSGEVSGRRRASVLLRPDQPLHE